MVIEGKAYRTAAGSRRCGGLVVAEVFTGECGHILSGRYASSGLSTDPERLHHSCRFGLIRRNLHSRKENI